MNIADLDQSTRTLMTEGRYLCDHLLRLEGHDGLDLAKALRPFELAPDGTVTMEDIEALNDAFQAAHDHASRAIDGQTLSRILEGKSPHIHRDSVLASIGLAAIGLALVVLTFHFTLWSNRAVVVMDQAEKFIEFEHFNHIMKAVEIQNYFDETEEARQAASSGNFSDLEPQLVYLEQLAVLETQYQLEVALPANMNQLLDDFNPAGAVVQRLKRRVCPQNRDVAAQTSLQEFICPPVFQRAPIAPPADEVTEEPTVVADAGSENDATVPSTTTDVGGADVSRADNSLTSINGFSYGLQRVAENRADAMVQAGRIIYGKFAQSQFHVEQLFQELRAQLNIVHLWALPILYGALGSVVYCIWRVLNTNVSGLGFLQPIMRMIFAGLAALTFSMLLVPSNILTVGVELNRPLIYLLSFVFGYSIEAFINTLNALNSYVTTSVSVRNKRPPASAA